MLALGQRLPLQAGLSDASIHLIENRREELAQMQWKARRMCMGPHEALETQGGFHKWGLPKSSWFILENPIKKDALGVSLFYVRRPS